MSKLLSVAIPCYEVGGKGRELLEKTFQDLIKQTFKNFDVTISDDSQDNEIMDLCKQWDNKLNIKYHRNQNGRGAASNSNNVIHKSTGKWVKLICQDDYFLNEMSLQKTVDALDKNHYWLVSAYWHSYNREGNNLERLHIPRLNSSIFIINTIGSPSGMTVFNLPDIPLMDTNLSYAYDCDFYHQMIQQYGNPIILEEPTIVNYLWDGSVTSSVNQELIDRENKYILNKYDML